MNEHADRDRTEPPSVVGYIDADIGQPPAGGAPGGRPLHEPFDRDANHTVPTDEQRRAAYAEALDLHSFGMAATYWQRFVLRVMAVADAELADLRAENDRLARGIAYEAEQGGIERRRQWDRATAAEAKVARAKELHQPIDVLGIPGTSLMPFQRCSCTRGLLYADCPTAAALNGHAQPEATEGGAR